jgi:DNA-binding transcriptional MerR regulator
VTEKKFLTMREVARKTQLPEYTLRYWESKFKLLRPLRLASGHRRYTHADVETLLEIKDLVFVKGYSLAGARKALSLTRRKKRADKAAAAYTAAAKTDLLEEIRKDLRQLIKDL